jgi:hypothetical protein
MRRRTKEKSSDLARLWTGELIRATPICNPCLDLIKGNSEPGPFELVEASAVFFDIPTFKIYNGIEECHRFGQDPGNLLPALRRHLPEAGVGIGVDLKRAAD